MVITEGAVGSGVGFSHNAAMFIAVFSGYFSTNSSMVCLGEGPALGFLEGGEQTMEEEAPAFEDIFVYLTVTFDRMVSYTCELLLVGTLIYTCYFCL
jgi:hypothetical protein